jgi:chromosome partitioning related protein ParA
MATRISIVSTKGGVGKTTLTANLGSILVDVGQRVLLVDANVQPTLSSYYRLAQQAPRGLTDVLETGDTMDSVSVTTIGCDIVLSNDPEARLPDWILHTPDGRFRLKRLLKHLEGYDFIVIDTQGATGPLQDMAVLAADFLISPIPPELLSAREFARGTIGMIERLSHRDMGFPLGNLYGLIYRMDRTADARDRRGTEGRMLRAVPRSHHDLGYGRARHRGLSRSRERPATCASMGTHTSRVHTERSREHAESGP